MAQTSVRDFLKFKLERKLNDIFSNFLIKLQLNIHSAIVILLKMNISITHSLRSTRNSCNCVTNKI